MFMLQLVEEHRIKQIAISWINIKDENYIVFQFQSQLPRHKWKLQLVLFISHYLLS